MRQDDDLKYFEEPEFKETLAQYEAAREAGTSLYMDADDLTDVAEYYSLVQNDDERADEAIQLALQLHPDAVSPQIFIARRTMQEGNIEGARLLCDAIGDQEHREVHFLRAELLLREQKNDEAYRFLHDVSRTIEEDLDYFLFDSAYIFIDYNDFASAKKFADELKEMAPIWFKTWELQADVQLGLNHNEEALPYIEKMLDKDPFYVEAWNWRTEAYSGLDQLDKALESSDYALAIAPSNERALQLKAWATMQNGNLEEAHALYQQLQAMSPDCDQHYLYDSYCLYDMGNTEEAMRQVELAEKLADGFSAEQTNIYLHHAHLLSDQGSVDAALKYIDLAEELMDEAVGWLECDLLRAQTYADNGHTSKALSILEKDMDRDKEHCTDIYHKGALVMFEAGIYDVAESMFSDLAKDAGDKASEADFHTYLAVCNHERGKQKKALEYLKKAVDGQASNVMDIFGYIVPYALTPEDCYLYYHRDIYGKFPDNQAPF